MIDVIGVRFKSAGKIYYFDPDGARIDSGENVIVETARGVEFGNVVIGNRQVADEDIVPPLKKVIRVATKADLQQKEINHEKEKEAFDIAIEKIKKHELEMKLVNVELTFDLNKIIFYFTADGRIDFRELVKDLAYVFRMRIELRQVGVRDESKFLSGIGICGRPLCCATFLDEFQPVSIKMAKEQSLSLNPTKISGICGRLMCCLKYEEETYEHLNKQMPGVGDIVKTLDGDGEVLSVSVLRQTARVAVRKKPTDSPTVSNYPVERIRVSKRKDPRKDGGIEGDLDDVDMELTDPDDFDKLKDLLEEAEAKSKPAAQEQERNRETSKDRPPRRKPHDRPNRKPRDAKPTESAQKAPHIKAPKPKDEKPREEKPREEKPKDDRPREERPKEEKAGESKPRGNRVRRHRPRGKRVEHENGNKDQ